MSKSLYWRFGVMGSGKSTQLLSIAHDYEINNELNILISKPSIDTKANDYIISRMGDDNIKKKCDFLIDPKMDIFHYINCNYNLEHISLIIIDEAHFMSEWNVKSLIPICKKANIPVICFGLRTTFDAKPFEGASWLFALADDIEEVTTRALCRSGNGKRATMNLRLVNGIPTFYGDEIVIDDANDTDNIAYEPVSSEHYYLLKGYYSSYNAFNKEYVSQWSSSPTLFSEEELKFIKEQKLSTFLSEENHIKFNNDVRVYIGSGAMFNQFGRIGLSVLSKIFDKIGLNYYLPQNAPFNDKSNENVEITCKDIVNGDVSELECCDFLFAHLTSDMDAGLCGEISRFNAMCEFTNSGYGGVVGWVDDIRLDSVPNPNQKGIHNQAMYMNQFVIGEIENSLGCHRTIGHCILEMYNAYKEQGGGV